MRMLTRTVSVVTLAVLCGSPTLAAQQKGVPAFQWFVGPQAGYMMFETQSQTMGGVFMAGIHTLITARRTALMISIEEGFGSDEQSAYVDASAPIGTCPGTPAGARCVTFDRVLRASAVLMAFPVGVTVQPYLGVGFGIESTLDPQPVFLPTEAGITPAVIDNAQNTASSLGSYGYGTLLGGLQVRLSRKFVVYGQAQVITAPSSGNLFTGAGYTLEGGFRFSLGSSKESLSGTGYQTQ